MNGDHPTAADFAWSAAEDARRHAASLEGRVEKLEQEVEAMKKDMVILRRVAHEHYEE